MLHINENLYINFSDMFTFVMGIYLVNLYDSRWFVSPYVHWTWLIKIQMRILSNAFKNIFIERSFVEVLWFGHS